MGDHETPSRSVDAPTMIARLETFVSRMERRYECKSETMAKDLAEGRARETAEVSRWIGEYHALTSLRARGHGAGSRTNGTEKSTSAAWKHSAKKPSSKQIPSSSS